MKKIICLFLILVLLSSCLSGCSLLGLTMLNKQELKPQTITPKETVDEIPAIESIPTDTSVPETAPATEVIPAMDMSNPISDLYAMTLVDESTEFSWEVSYHVPQINCDSEDARRINKEIDEEYSRIIDEELDSQQNGYSFTCEYIKWELISNGQYTFTLIITSGYPSDCRYYTLYNFNALTGKEISNKEILEQFGLSADEFVAMAKETAGNIFLARAEAFGETDNYVQRLLDGTVSDENIHKNMPLFVNENGTLCIITPIGSFAGADFYYEIIELT